MRELRTTRGRLIVLVAAGLMWVLPTVLPAEGDSGPPPAPVTMAR